MSKKAVAFFDFDGTISHKDSFLEFLIYAGGYFKFLTCLCYNSIYILLKLAGAYPNDLLKERFFSFFFKGKEESEINGLGEKFASKELPNQIYDAAKFLLDWHLKEDHEVVILTASSSIWLGPWAKANGFNFIGTTFESINGKLTGKIKGKNCYGAEKLNRIKHLLEEYPFNLRYAYGDSKSDQYYLDIAKHSFLFPLTEKNVRKKIPYFPK